jgi:hypothetical protein
MFKNIENRKTQEGYIVKKRVLKEEFTVIAMTIIDFTIIACVTKETKHPPKSINSSITAYSSSISFTR